MKANELSVGDWVCAKMMVFNGEERLTPPMRIVAIGETWVELRIDPEAGDPDEYAIEDIRPVPLDVDILRGNGFIEAVNTPYFIIAQTNATKSRDALFVKFYKNVREIHVEYTPINERDGKCDYMAPEGMGVHEFQHILRLARIDKEIIL